MACAALTPECVCVTVNPAHMRKYARTLLKRLDAGDWTAFLVGLGGGFLAFGLLEYFFRLFDPTPTTWRMVVGVFLAALSAGLLVPHRLATWLAAQMWRRLRAQRPPPVSYASFLPAQKDRPLHRVVLAGLALLCGGTSIVSLSLFRLARQAHEFLLGEFLLGPASLVAIECALVVVVGWLVFLPIGLTWGCVHHLSCPVGGWRVRPLVGVAVGLAVAALVGSANFGSGDGLEPNLLALMGSVPFFVLSILSTRLSRQPNQNASVTPGEVSRPASQIRDRWPRLVQAVVIVVFGCAVLSVGIWLRVFGILGAEMCRGGTVALAMWCLGFAVGAAVGCSRSSVRTHSIGAFGFVCTLAGLGTALSAGLLGSLGVCGYRLAGCFGGVYLLSAIVVGLSAFGMGYAVIYGFYTVLTWASHQSEVGPALLSRLVLAGAVVVVFVLTPLVRSVGTYAGLVAVSLVLVGVGGALIIHEPTYPRKTRRRRLGVILVAIVFMSLALPRAGNGWLVTRPWKRLCLEENAWLTKSVWAVQGDIRSFAEPVGHDLEPAASLFAPARGGFHDIVDWTALPGSPRVALVGAGAQPLANEIVAVGLRCDQLLYEPNMPPSARVEREPATRFLRRTRRCYDMIVIGATEIPPAAWTTASHAAMFQRALDCLRVDGVVILMMPIRHVPRSNPLDCLEALRIAGCTDFTLSLIHI